MFLVAESGVHSPVDARRMVQEGADALLGGTELMGRPRGCGIVKRSVKELWTKIDIQRTGLKGIAGAPRLCLHGKRLQILTGRR